MNGYWDVSDTVIGLELEPSESKSEPRALTVEAPKDLAIVAIVIKKSATTAGWGLHGTAQVTRLGWAGVDRLLCAVPVHLMPEINQVFGGVWGHVRKGEEIFACIDPNGELPEGWRAIALCREATWVDLSDCNAETQAREIGGDEEDEGDEITLEAWEAARVKGRAMIAEFARCLRDGGTVDPGLVPPEALSIHVEAADEHWRRVVWTFSEELQEQVGFSMRRASLEVNAAQADRAQSFMQKLFEEKLEAKRPKP